MRYDYDVESETFIRVDGRGRPLMFNITEAKRIESLRNLGFSVQKIYDKMDFVNDVTVTNLRTFIKNMEHGELSTEGDYPAPTPVFKDLDLEARVSSLEDRFADLEKLMKLIQNGEYFCRCSAEESITDKVKSWIMK